MKRIPKPPAFFALLAMMATAAPCPPSEMPEGDLLPKDPRIQRQLALAAELEAEGATNEARLVRAEIVAGNGPAEACRSDMETAPPRRVASRGGIGSWFARGVVSFYRTFVGPAIGARCALEPSCSRYFLEASRRHGLLGLPMVADRFVREPPASAPDRPWVQTPSGQWRHPDPVSDHDWWF